jgi:hypothetical protein
MQRPEPEKAEQPGSGAEPVWLLELKEQGRKAQKHRDWERQVLYLKESDEQARLEAYFEMLLKRLDLPAAGMETEDFPEWVKEHGDAVAFLYSEPELPEKCDSSGALTKEIRKLASSLVQPAVMPPPPELAEDLIAESDEVPAEMAKLRSGRNWLECWFVAYLCISVCFFTLLAISCLDLFGLIHLHQAPRSEPGSPVATTTTIEALIFAIGAFGTLAVAIVLGLRRQRKGAEFEQSQRELQERRTKLGQEVERVQAEACQSYRLAVSAASQARERLLRDLVGAVAKWRSTVRLALVEDFFEQGLWMHDKFTERLKPLLAEVQRPYPTSCRVEVSTLREDQTESAFSVLTAVIASRIAVKVELSRTGALAQLIVAGTEPGVPMPSAAEVLEKLEDEGVLLKGERLSEDTAACMAEVLKLLRA